MPVSRHDLSNFSDELKDQGWEFIICVLGEEVNGVTKPLSFISANIEDKDSAHEMINLLKEEIKEATR